MSLSKLVNDSDTDSADETFVFTRKRKANKFFIDLTEEHPESKRKINSDGSTSVANHFLANLHDDSDSCANQDIKILKVIPGDSDLVHPQGKSSARKVVENV